MREPTKPNVATFKGASWTVGIKDSGVYWEIWNADRTIKIAEGTVDAVSARHIGQAFLDKAAELGETR